MPAPVYFGPAAPHRIELDRRLDLKTCASSDSYDRAELLLIKIGAGFNESIFFQPSHVVGRPTLCGHLNHCTEQL